jgi:alkanesulfonate monooxygenase SsuD/methylene tetrahydromethanopterin reductase-like flavin-dependent oxidoreductase (luciferase family)
MVPLLREGHVTFSGRYHQTVDAELRPTPIREGGPPVLIAGKRPRMLDLVARYADQWNAAWYGHPDEAHELRERLTNLHAALDSAGRDPATLEITAGIFVAFEGAEADAPERAIRGSLDEVADALAGYAALGVSHLIAHVFPRTTEAVRSLGEAAALARERIAAPVG